MVVLGLLSVFAIGQEVEIPVSKSLDELKKEADFLFSKGKYLSAAKTEKEAYSLISKDSLELTIKSLYFIGNAYQSSRLVDSAKYYYNKADKLITESLSDAIKFQKYFYKASLHYTLRQVDSAMYNMIRALDYAEKTGSPLSLASANSSMGLIFLDQDNYKKAESYLTQAYDYAKKTDDSVKIAFCIMNLGRLDFDTGDYESAERKIKEALFIYTNQGNTNGIVMTKGFLSKVYLFQGRKEEAAKVTHELLPLIYEMEFSNDLSKMIFNTKKIVALESDSSDNALTEATKLFDENKKISQIPKINVEQSISEISYLQENKGSITEDKLSEVYKSLATKDSLYQASLNSKYHELETQYQTEKKEKENQRLLFEAEKQKLLVEKEKNTKYSIIGGFVLLSIIFFVFLFYKRKKAQWRAKLAIVQAKQDEHQKIGDNLHDSKAKDLEIIANLLNSKGETVLAKKVDQVRLDLRKLSHDLTQVPFTESEFDEQLNTLAASYSSDSFYINVKGLKTINWKEVNDIVKRTLFSSLKECVSNAYNHAKASLLNISFENHSEKLFVSLVDNGQGFHAAVELKATGIVSVNHALKEINGTMTIESHKNEGTSIEIQLPLH
ncbi:MAG: hypothetical protein KDC90_00040 [Ignavibacteriae bacterium]|nr:hypothetical protein [Ignavibacteriota bacterium]